MYGKKSRQFCIDEYMGEKLTKLGKNIKKLLKISKPGIQLNFVSFRDFLIEKGGNS
jgi:hypothetical protein